MVRRHNELPSSMKATLQSIVQRFWQKCRLYGEDGTVWRIEPTSPPALSFSARVLVEIGFYKPQRSVSMAHRPVGRYTLSDLKMIVGDCLPAMTCGDPPVDEDGTDLVRKSLRPLTHAASFDEVVRVLREFTPTSDRTRDTPL